MRDPFPIPAPGASISVVDKASAYFGLSTLPLHLHEILLAAITYHIICVEVSPYLSGKLFPHIYPSLPWRTKLNWDVHVVSLVQSTMINAVGLWVTFCDEERAAMDWRERVWGYDGALGMIVALATGYFLWDLVICAYYVNVFGPGLLAHAVSALAVYLLGFRPLVNYYAPVFILFELSSPFLNFHWFFDKVNMTGSKAQLYNGILLTSTFFGSRLVWGTYNCFRVFPDILKILSFQQTAEGKAWMANKAANATMNAAAAALKGDQLEAARWRADAPKELPYWMAGVYISSYVVLMALNVVWFGKMIQTIRARFEPPLGTKRPQKAKKEKRVSVDGCVEEIPPVPILNGSQRRIRRRA